MFFKVYVSETEKVEIETRARVEGCSVSTLFKKALNLESTSKISSVLADTIALAEALSSGDFFLPDLYSGVEWAQLAKDINPGQLGKQFYEQVIYNSVSGVSFKEMKNRRALYTKEGEADD